MIKKIPLLINTCDKYQFLLPILARNIDYSFGGFFENIFINNEIKKDYDCSYKYISDLRGEKNFPMHIWTDHIRTAVQTINSEYVILTQDDYYFTKKLNVDRINIAYEKISKNCDISCIHLSSHILRYNDICNNFSAVSFTKYYLNTQFAIWRSSDLISVLDQKMNAWAWELRGHKNIGNKNIKVIALSEPAVEYIALIKKGKLLPIAQKYLDNSDYLEILNKISLYKSSFGDKIKTLINSFNL